MKLSDVISFLSLIVSIVSMLIALRSIKISKKVENKAYKRNFIPSISIDKINFPKSSPNSPDWQHRHFRYYYGEMLRDITCDNNIKVVQMNESMKEDLLDKKGKIYFQDSEKLCVMLNMLDNDKNIVVECQSTVVTFRNNGDTLQKMSFIGADVTYLNDGKRHFEGLPEFARIINVKRDETFDMVINEATNDFRDSICELNTDVYKNSQDGMNILNKKFDQYFLKYKELKCRCFLYDVDNERYECEIWVKLEGDHLLHGVEMKDDTFV